MSVQFGHWNFDGRTVDPEYLAKAARLLAPYGPDGESAYIEDGLGIVFRPFATTQEARREKQPYALPSGGVLVWDGRLDNRRELVRELGHPQHLTATDLEIVGAAYEQWGTDSLGKLIGDWALSVWEPKSRSLLLTKDPIGTRHLYYSIEKDQVTWSTILDPLVLLSGKTFALEEEYIAGWLAFFPATHLTPYAGVNAVPPASVVRITVRGCTVRKYWDFDPAKRIQYPNDGEYEEHFRQVFGEAVRRRLRSDTPVLAELSGGMDSSSIVCMADHIVATGCSEAPRIDTLSFFNDSEPNWNERPYFAKVEEKRGRIGCHIDTGSESEGRLRFASSSFVAVPGATSQFPEAARKIANFTKSQGHRVLLSGIGGDEVTGGVPTFLPEILDLLSAFKLKELAHQLKVWAIEKRRPWFYILAQAISAFFPSGMSAFQVSRDSRSWFTQAFQNQNRSALKGYPQRLRVFGPRPAVQDHLRTMGALRRQLAAAILDSEPPLEKRYPFLDRDLLEFSFAIPPQQLVRPGQRRSLMRRALRGIVPGEVLDRKRKAFVSRAPLAAIAAEWDSVIALTKWMVLDTLGIIARDPLVSALDNARRGQNGHFVPLVRVLALESWLRTINATAGRPVIRSYEHSANSRPTHRDRKASRSGFPSLITNERR